MRGKKYTTEEVRNILADRKSGMSYSHLKLKYGRVIGGLRHVVRDYQRFQRGDKSYMNKGMIAILSAVNANGFDTPVKVEVSTEPRRTDSLSQLESAFKAFQEATIEVIDQEVKRRSGEWVARAMTAETELKKYQEAAQNSSMVGALRRRWGLGAPGQVIQ